MLHNTAVKSPAWMAALLICAAIHAIFLLPAVPAVASAFAARGGQALPSGALQVLIFFAIGWSVIMSVWCAMVTNVLSRESNRWGGLRGLRLVGVVAGLTLACELATSPCLFVLPPTVLVVPILSYVAISNVSMPFEDEASENTDEPTAHG